MKTILVLICITLFARALYGHPVDEDANIKQEISESQNGGSDGEKPTSVSPLAQGDSALDNGNSDALVSPASGTPEINTEKDSTEGSAEITKISPAAQESEMEKQETEETTSKKPATGAATKFEPKIIGMLGLIYLFVKNI